jgi:hypothetical protein
LVFWRIILYSSAKQKAPADLDEDQRALPLFLAAMMAMMMVTGMTRSMSWDHCAGKDHQRDGSEKHTTNFHFQTLTKTRPLHRIVNASWAESSQKYVPPHRTLQEPN